MIKFGILLPEEGMIFQIKEELKEFGEEIAFASVTTNHDIIRRTIDAINQGTDILIARGYQAMIVKDRFNLPIINIKFTTAEIGILLKNGKKLCKSEHPYIAIVAFENMLPDLKRMSELFDIELEVIYLDQLADVRKILIAKARKPDLVIGGKEVNEIAAEMHIPTMYYQTDGESVHEAVKEALCKANEIRAQREEDTWVSALMDSGFCAVILIDRYGKINRVNHLAEAAFDLKLEKTEDKYLVDVFPGLSDDQIQQVLSGKSSAEITNLRIGESNVRANVTGVSGESGILGAIVILDKEDMLFSTKALVKSEATEVSSAERLPELKSQFMQARTFAMSDLPVLISASAEDEGVFFAKYIHENSIRNRNAFVEIDVANIRPERQQELFFRKLYPELDGKGERTGFAIHANHGTLFLRNIEKLTPQMQSWFYHAASPYKERMHSDTIFSLLDFRLIATTTKSLEKLVQEGQFDGRLYLLLSALSIRIPPLKERPDDIKELFQRYFKENLKRYGKPLKMTNGGIEILPKLPWSKGEVQIQLFAERVVLSAMKRNIDEVFLKQQFYEIFSDQNIGVESKRVVIYRSEEGDAIRKALEESHGNRKQASLRLGISVATLWRKMKKYGIDASYENVTD